MSDKKNYLKDVTIRACTPAEYDEMIAFLDVGFHKPEKKWFDRYYGHIFQRKEPYVSCNYLVRKAARLIGVIGIYPYKQRIGKAVLSVGGVGSVSTHPDARGRGVMSLMLKHIKRELVAGGYDVSWLSGDRYRYRNYGWEQGGSSYVYAVNARDIGRYHPSLPSVRVRRGGPKDFPLLSRLYRQFPSCVVRTPADWHNRMRRQGFEIRVATSARGSAYQVYNKKNAESIAEMQGEPMTALALLSAHMKKVGAWRVDIQHPTSTDRVAVALQGIAANVRHNLRGQMQVVRVDATFSKLVAEVKRRQAYLRPSVLSELSRVKSERDKRTILGRLLGFHDSLPPFPVRLRKFEPLRPLGWWISEFDGV